MCYTAKIKRGVGDPFGGHCRYTRTAASPGDGGAGRAGEALEQKRGERSASSTHIVWLRCARVLYRCRSTRRKLSHTPWLARLAHTPGLTPEEFCCGEMSCRWVGLAGQLRRPHMRIRRHPLPMKRPPQHTSAGRPSGPTPGVIGPLRKKPKEVPPPKPRERDAAAIWQEAELQDAGHLDDPDDGRRAPRAHTPQMTT